MKRKITLLLLAASSVLTMKSQVVLNEGFDAPFSLTASGWAVSNLSSPTSTLGWFQGNGNAFASYIGGADDYYAVNRQSTSAASGGGISNWLFTPTVSIYNGAILRFATKTVNQGGPNYKPDRLQVRMNYANTSTVIPTGTANVGSYTTLMLDINPNLNTNTLTAITNGTMVDGYPNVWTVYTLQVTGVPGIQTGRFAFRYFVDNAGTANSATVNANYIGLDEVRYVLPCGTSVNSYTTCSGQPVILQAQGGLAATTYSWTGPAGAAGNTQTISVPAPSSGSAVYTLAAGAGTNVCPTQQTATITVGTALSINLLSSQSNTSPACSGDVIALAAVSAGTNYVWTANGNPTPIGTSSLITYTLAANTTFSVLSSVNNCFGTSGITYSVNPTPTLAYTVNSPTICPGKTITFTTTGASIYGYYFDPNDALALATPISTTNPFSIPLTTTMTPSNYGIYVVGVAANGCFDIIEEDFTVAPIPTVAVSSSSANVCRNATVTLTGSGADTYSWSATGIPAGTNTDNPLSFPVGTVAVTRTITVLGTSVFGCTATTAFTQSVSLCLGIETLNGNNEASAFPNPFTSELKLSGFSGNSIEVYNTLGQIVIKTTIRDNSEMMSTSDLTKGIYILKAYDSDGTLTKTIKLLKN